MIRRPPRSTLFPESPIRAGTLDKLEIVNRKEGFVRGPGPPKIRRRSNRNAAAPGCFGGDDHRDPGNVSASAQIPGCTFFTVRLSHSCRPGGLPRRAAYIRSANYPRVCVDAIGV